MRIRRTIGRKMRATTLIETQRRALSKLQALQSLTDVALSTLDLDGLLRSLLERSIQMVSADGGALLMLDQREGVLLVRASRGIPEEVLRGYRRRLGDGISGRAAAERAPVFIADLDRVPDLPAPLSRARNVRSVVAVPLVGRARTLGVLRLDGRESNHFTEEHVQLMTVAAERMALAIENAELLREAEERAAHQELIGRIASAIGASLDLDTVVNTAIEETALATGASRCLVFLGSSPDPGRGSQWEYRAQGVPPVKDLPVPPYVREFVRRVMASEEPVWVDDVSGALRARGTSPAVPDRGVQSILSSRIVHAGEPIGILTLHQCDRPRSWTEREIGLIKAVATQLTVALENARLYGETDEKLRQRINEVSLQNRRTEALLASMNEGMFATDAEGRVTAMNSWLLSILGCRIDQVLGRPYFEVLRPADQEDNPLSDARCPVCAAISLEAATAPKMVFLPLGEKVRMATSWSVAPIRDEADRVVGCVSIVRDVTREWELDKVKNGIISVVSHEFRTPLTSIIGFSELLLTRDQDEGERRTCLKYILDEGLRLETLVNDFLDLSRLEAGKVVLHPRPLDLEAEVAGCLERLRAQSNGRSIEVDLQRNLPPLVADPYRFQQVLTNLLSNAFKYSDEYAPVAVRARSAAHGDVEGIEGGDAERTPWILLTVEDRGVGIAAEEISNLFTPFHRVDNAQTRGTRGTGLGLSIVKHLVESHGGKVWVDSAVGVGSKFHVALPVTSAEC